MKYLIYVTMGKPYIAYEKHIDEYITCKSKKELGQHGNLATPYDNVCALQDYGVLTNGHILAEFECDKVEEIVNLGGQNIFETQALDCIELLKKSCLFKEDLDKYLIKEYEDTTGYALHIKNLKIFDRPLELCEVYKRGYYHDLEIYETAGFGDIPVYFNEDSYKFNKAPQNMCYCEYDGELCVLISIRPEWACKIFNGEKTIEIRKKIMKGMM